LPIENPNYTRQSFDLENETWAWIQSVASPDQEIPRTAAYRILNALLDLSIHQIREAEIPGLESWEVLAMINFFRQTKFRELDPDLFWVRISDFNEELAQKVSRLPREIRLLLLLKILYERKNDLSH
jgi:hypothetical protein